MAKLYFYYSSMNAGKSTALRMLAGLETVNEGSIFIDGDDVTGLDADALADIRRDKLGIVFQSFHLIPTMTALETRFSD